MSKTVSTSVQGERRIGTTLKRTVIVDLETSGRSVDTTTAGGNECIVYGQLGEQLHGSYYSSDEGWVPCRWNLDGTFINVENPRGLDITIEEA